MTRSRHPALTACISGGLALGCLGAGAFIAGLVHAHDFRVRHRVVFVSNVPAQLHPLRILHLSDAHLLARHHARARFIRSLASECPDLVVLTGDMIAEPRAYHDLMSALTPLLSAAGAFVFGSNDYYSARPKNPLRYLWRTSADDVPDSAREPDLPWPAVARELTRHGWYNLTNRRASCTVRGWAIDMVGVDDAHADLDSYPKPRHDAAAAHIRIGLTHAPYTRILNAMHHDGCDLIFAGHTHGGQVCLPGEHALTSNCDLPPALAAGLIAWPHPLLAAHDSSIAQSTAASGRAEPHNARNGAHTELLYTHDAVVEQTPGRTWVQISRGIGAATYMPVRAFCPPEAIILDVVPASSTALLL